MELIRLFTELFTKKPNRTFCIFITTGVKSGFNQATYKHRICSSCMSVVSTSSLQNQQVAHSIKTFKKEISRWIYSINKLKANLFCFWCTVMGNL